MTKSWYTNPSAIYWRNARDFYEQIPDMKCMSHLPIEGFAPRLMEIADFANGSSLMALVSCKPKNKLPEVIPGTPRYWGRRVKSSAHRLFTRCPGCQKEIPSGRMHQHFVVHVGRA